MGGIERVVVRIVSGGQSGVDRTALDAAVALGIAYDGWCPAGGWAEDRTDPPGLLADYPGLRATKSPDPAVRTRWNVRDIDATLVVRPGQAASPGTQLTIEVARELGRPCLVTSGDADEVRPWLAGLGNGLALNVAGPRESEGPGTYDLTRTLLLGVLRG